MLQKWKNSAINYTIFDFWPEALWISWCNAISAVCLPPGSLGEVSVLTVLGLEVVVDKLRATPESGLSVGLAQRPLKKANKNKGKYLIRGERKRSNHILIYDYMH